MTKLRPTRSKSRQRGSPSLTNSCISDPWAGPILNSSLNNKDNTYWRNFMKGYAEITQVVGHWHIGPIPKVTTGRPCEQMSSPVLENVIVANDKLPYQDSRPKC